MNLRVAGSVFAVLLAVSLIGYGLNAYVNAALGVEETIFNHAWQLIALSLGLSLAAGIAYPHARGIRAGDRLAAQVQSRHAHGPAFLTLFSSLVVTALENGRAGQAIRVRLPNGGQGRGTVLDYGGAFALPSIQLVETEVEFLPRRA